MKETSLHLITKKYANKLNITVNATVLKILPSSKKTNRNKLENKQNSKRQHNDLKEPFIFVAYS